MPKIVASKKDWIKLGYKLFSENGEGGINVDKMSRLLNCNKSSFYWHFKTKKDFINELIAYWIDIDTTKVINEVDEQEFPKDKILKLIKVAFRKDSNLDFIFYLKKYSQKNNTIQKIIDRIDDERILFLIDLIIGLGYSKEQAEIKASIFYKYLIGYHEMIRYKKQKKNYLVEVLDEINQFITIK
ncbi:TetR/AcrR family transcriptional regulator [Kordia sp.]|uniref:TetR/AcrR family transcriptional regulator n=1 Tax=Kordia sp. TaxID=1965332 RepID=UPI003B5B8CC5